MPEKMSDRTSDKKPFGGDHSKYPAIQFAALENRSFSHEKLEFSHGLLYIFLDPLDPSDQFGFQFSNFLMVVRAGVPAASCSILTGA